MNTKTKTCLQCSAEVHQRGLCTTCYGRFTRSKQRLPKEKQDAFEEALIATGKLLPVGRRPPATPDEYAELAEELLKARGEDVPKIVADFQTRQQQSQKQSVQQEAEDVVRKAKKAARRKGITPKDRKAE